MTSLDTLSQLSDEELVGALRDLIARTSQLTAELLVHLVEVEARELHLKVACASMFAYCTEILGLDEGAAYNRITVARLARRFPAILAWVADGRLHLSGLRLLGPHLTEANHIELLEAAGGKTKRQIEAMLAARFPKPDVPARIRKLPAPRTTRPGTSSPSQATLDHTPVGEPVAAAARRADSPAPATAAASGEASTPTAPVDAGEAQTNPAPSPPRAEASRSKTAPLSADRYKVEFTAGAELVDKIERVKALLGHREPGCDVVQVVDQALSLLEAKLLKERFGAGARRRRTNAPKSGPTKTTRHIPRAVRRDVLARDGLRCAYVDPATGKRCTERRVEFQHHRPFGLGGEHSADNISLYCPAHNKYAASRDYGREHMAAAAAQRPPAAKQQCLDVGTTRADPEGAPGGPHNVGEAALA